MDVAARDQFKASAAEWAFQLRANYEALVAEGFTDTQATTILAASFVQNAGMIQASSMQQLVERLLAGPPEAE